MNDDEIMTQIIDSIDNEICSHNFIVCRHNKVIVYRNRWKSAFNGRLFQRVIHLLDTLGISIMQKSIT